LNRREVSTLKNEYLFLITDGFWQGMNKFMSKTKTLSIEEQPMTTYLATAIAEGFCEGEGASEEMQIKAWQYLIDIGTAWQLQGWFGRQATALIEAGICKPAKKSN
jgi:hypothetical protein